jgi:DNA-binding NtrC family response regulator
METDLKSRRLNPVVDRFVTTDLPIQEIATISGTPDSPMLRALVMMANCLDGQVLARDAMVAARGVALKGADPELTVLMLSRWAELACRFSQPTEAEAILHQIRTFLPDTPHPEIRAVFLLAQASLAEARGSHTEREQLLREILAILKEHSPRRKYYLWELGMLLAQQGRGAEFRTELNQLNWQCNARFTTDRVLLIRFINAVETGHIQDASELLPQIATDMRASLAQRRTLYREYQALLALMHAVVTRQTPRHELVMPPKPVWIQTVYHLLRNDAPQALKSARLEARQRLDSIFGIGFGSLNLARCELASGNWEAAKRLVELRRKRGNPHYLDSFFLARTACLEQNRREAAEQFARALAAVDRYEARPRLDFELLLAVELSQSETIDLTRRAATVVLPTTAPQPPQGSAPALVGAGPRSTPDAAAADRHAPVGGATRVRDAESGMRGLVGRSSVMQKIRETIQQFASLDAPILIIGETGTGKEIVAHALHATGKRRSRPFLAINCGAITETLLESELFGHERGAFTGADRAHGGLFEEAGDGTIFLDEIAEISPRLQTVLLRVLESGEIRAIGSTKPRMIHCRVVAATNADLGQRVADGLFRRDLLYRLQRLYIHIPPLRERRDDVMLLARQFLDEGRAVGSHCTVSRSFADALRTYDWPGNVRELRNVIERMRLTHSDKLNYTHQDLDIRLSIPVPEVGSLPPTPPAAADDANRQQPAGRASHPAPAFPTPASGTGGPLAAAETGQLISQGTSPLRRQDRLRDLFRQYGKLTRNEVTKILDISPNTATKYLKDLCDEGFIRRVEPSASSRSHYFALVRHDGS